MRRYSSLGDDGDTGRWIPETGLFVTMFSWMREKEGAATAMKEELLRRYFPHAPVLVVGMFAPDSATTAAIVEVRKRFKPREVLLLASDEFADKSCTAAADQTLFFPTPLSFVHCLRIARILRSWSSIFGDAVVIWPPAESGVGGGMDIPLPDRWVGFAVSYVRLWRWSFAQGLRRLDGSPPTLPEAPPPPRGYPSPEWIIRDRIPGALRRLRWIGRSDGELDEECRAYLTRYGVSWSMEEEGGSGDPLLFRSETISLDPFRHMKSEIPARGARAVHGYVKGGYWMERFPSFPSATPPLKRKPRVLLDGRELYRLLARGMEGVPRVIYEVTRRLVELDREIEYWMVGYTDCARPFFPELSGLHWLPCWVKSREPRRQPELSAIARWLGADLFHSFSGNLPTAAGCPITATIHGTIEYDRPVAYGDTSDLTLLRQRVSSADHLVSVSNTSADNLVRLLGVCPSRITVIPNGVACGVASGKHAEEVNGFLLFSHWPRYSKGVFGLLNAYRVARLACADLPKLRIAGELTRSLWDCLDSLGLSEFVEVLGRRNDRQLARDWERTVALLAPSHEEAFDLPVLEAMANRVPVIASDIPVHREVAGRVAWFVPEDNAQAWAEAMVNVYLDVEGCRERGDSGVERSKAFSWELSAEGYASLFHRLIGLPEPQ